MSRYFPGITPLNVNDLTLDYWSLYVAHTKKFEKQAAERARAGRRR